jgi:hypothetical protein
MYGFWLAFSNFNVEERCSVNLYGSQLDGGYLGKQFTHKHQNKFFNIFFSVSIIFVVTVALMISVRF